MINIINYIGLIIVIYFICLCIGYSVLLIAAFPDILNKFRETEYTDAINLINDDQSLPVTIVVPAFNERTRIFNTIESILNNDYKSVTLIIVNDGSTDDTVELLKQKYDLYEVPKTIRQVLKTSKLRHAYQSRSYPNMILLDKEHDSTGDCLNLGINACRTPLFATIDADTVLEPDGLSQIMLTFLTSESCIAIGGAVYVINGNRVANGVMLDTNIPRSFVPAVQSIEYLRSFLYGRAGWNYFGGALSYAGAFTFFEKEIVQDIGGYDAGNYAQDAEIIVKLHEKMRKNNYPYSIKFTPGALVWTEVPGTLKRLWVQRDHWHRGMLRSFLLHKKMCFNPRYGVVGLFSYPFYFIFEIMGPAVEAVSYVFFLICWCFGVINVPILLWFILLAWGYIAFLSMACVLINLITFNKYHKVSDTLRFFWLVFAQFLGYRQVQAFCCLSATFHYFFNKIRRLKH